MKYKSEDVGIWKYTCPHCGWFTFENVDSHTYYPNDMGWFATDEDNLEACPKCLEKWFEDGLMDMLDLEWEIVGYKVQT